MNHISNNSGSIYGINNIISGIQKKNKACITPNVEDSNNVDISSSPAGMKMGEYKRYIYGRISELPVHPTQLNCSASVFISEEGFSAMQDSPEF